MEQFKISGIQRSHLVRAISDLYGSQGVASAVRKEASPKISEYGIPPDTARKLTYTLCRSLKSKVQRLHSRLYKTRTLEAFDATLARRISQKLSFKKLKLALNRWNTTIHSMRNNDQLVFPLNQGTLSANRLKQNETKMCISVENQQTGFLSEAPFANNVPQPKEECKTSMTNAITLLRDKAKFNARYSYMLAKAARHRKMKGKKYSRLFKHDHVSCPENTGIFNKSDVLKAEQLIESSEKKRAKERATLRHRSTGQWIQHLKTRAKQNSASRKQLMQHMSRSCELNWKPASPNSSEDDSDEHKNNREAIVNNPWILEGDAGIHSEKMEPKLPSDKQDVLLHHSRVQFEMSPEKITKENYILKSVSGKPSNNMELVHISYAPSPTRNETLNPSIFIPMKLCIFQLKDPCLQDSSNSNNAEDNAIGMNIINEAFADDDIVTEFRKERECISNKFNLENNDPSIPGWGKWSEKGSHNSPRKIWQSVVKSNRITLGKYDNKKDVIFIEDKTDKLKEQQVNEISSSFTRIKDYEASIRFPLGNTWAPRSAHNKLVIPALVTLSGAVIKPIQAYNL